MPQAGLIPQTTATFLGVNLRADRVSLADEQLAKAINADLHTQPGTIVLRLGRTRQNSSALSDPVIRRLARINAKRYRVAGTSVYSDSTKIIDGLLHANLITTLAPFRPLNDTTTWAFIGDDAVMRKADGTTARNWGIAAPDTFTERIGYKGSLTGAYTLRVTGIRFASAGVVGHEGNPSDATTSVTLTSQDLCIGDILHADAQVDGFGMYRTIAGGSSHLLDKRVAIPTSSATVNDPAYSVTHDWEAPASPGALLLHFTRKDTAHLSSTLRATQSWETASGFTGEAEDTNGRTSTTLWAKSVQAWVTTQAYRWAFASNTADGSLGAAVETDNNVPPTTSYVIPFQEHMFFLRDASNPHYLWWSKRFKPESVPTDQFLEVGTPDDPLQAAVTIAGLFGVFSRKTKYRIFGNATSGFVHVEALSKRGTPAPMAVIGTEFGSVFVARNGVYVTNFTTPDEDISNLIWPLFAGETVNDMPPINWTTPAQMSADVFKDRYYLAYPDGDSAQPNKLAVYSNDTKNWYFYDHPLASLFYEEDTDLLTAGGTNGFITLLENGVSDEGSNIALDVETKDYSGETKDLLKLFEFVRVDGNTLGQDVTLKFYVDDTLKHTTTFNMSSRTEKLLPLPEGTMGYHWRIRFQYTGTTRIRLHPPAALYVPLSFA